MLIAKSPVNSEARKNPPKGLWGVIPNPSMRYPHVTPVRKEMACTATAGAKKEGSVIAAPIKTKAASPRVAIRVAITVP